MLSLNALNNEEILTFFAVLVRFATIFAVAPFLGDRTIPNPVKILLSLSVTICLFPSLVKHGFVRPGEAIGWGATTGGIASVVILEAIAGLIFGFVARFAFDAIQFSGNLIGNFMGLSSASIFDPHQESHSQLLAQIQMSIAMMLFLAVDGHHLMMRAALESYAALGLGRLSFNEVAKKEIIAATADIIRIGVQMTGPIAVSLFAVQITFGVLSKAMPQVNILSLSFSITIGVGLFVLLASMESFIGVSNGLFSRMGTGLESMMLAMAGR